VGGGWWVVVGGVVGLAVIAQAECNPRNNCKASYRPEPSLPLVCHTCNHMLQLKTNLLAAGRKHISDVWQLGKSVVLFRKANKKKGKVGLPARKKNS